MAVWTICPHLTNLIFNPIYISSFICSKIKVNSISYIKYIQVYKLEISLVMTNDKC